MSKENVKLFLNKLNEDQKLQEQLARLTTKYQEELANKIIEIGAENGYEFGKEDMDQFTKERLMESGELSEAEMEAVAGGGMYLNYDKHRIRLTVIDPIKPQDPIDIDVENK